MAKNKNNKAVWGSRIKQKSSVLFRKVGSSIKTDKRLYKQDINGSIVHVEMLFKQKIIPFRVKNKIIYGLNKIKKEIEKNIFKFDDKHEDIHMNIENRLYELIGEEAGYLHTARSRNDQVITDLKLWMKDAVNEINTNLNKLMQSILNLSSKNIYTIMPAHYLLAYVEMFMRDKKRFRNNLDSLSENPLGVAALTGTSFNIDRIYTTNKLKFKKPTDNSVDTVSDRDFVLDFLYNISMCSQHISRIAEELIIWNSDSFELISLSDKIVTGSSIMPQKKNPDQLEFLRGKTGSIYGNLFSMMTILKGLPLSYFKDLQDDKKFIFSSYEDIINCLKILTEIFKNFKPNKKEMISLAHKGYITSTDLADFLVKNHSMSFRKAYQTTAKIVNLAESKKKRLDELELIELKKIEPKLDVNVLKIFDLKNSINSKKSHGGTAFGNIKKMIIKYKKNI